MEQEKHLVNYKEFMKVKQYFKDYPLEFYHSAGKNRAKEIWSLQDETDPLFGQEVEKEENSYIFHYYVYPLAYSLIYFKQLSAEVKPTSPKEKKYILTQTELSELETTLFRFKCQRAELFDDTEPGYAERLIKYLYPEAWREGEGIYWDIVGDSIIKERCEAGFYREYKDE